MRYIFPSRNDGACITAEEIADFNANSLPYGLVMEAEATWILRGYQSGFDLARAARQIEASLGIPAGVTFAAVDFDIGSQQYPQAFQTLHGLADGYGSWSQVGVYGSKGFCEWVGANSQITKFWSTDAWSNYTPASNAALHQNAQWPAGTPVVPGCDHNLILGDWAPRTTENDLTPDEHNVLYTTAKAVVQLAGVVSQLVADEATRSQIITKGDPTHYGLAQVHADLQAIEVAVKAVPPAGGTDLAPVLAAINNLKLGAIQ
jgi:hypothetical protein